MVVKRTIDGADVEVELTPEEIKAAYEERLRELDREDVESLVDYVSDQTCQLVYGITKEQFYELIPDIAREMRRNIDMFGMEFSEARQAAVTDVIGEEGASDV